ncbi:hypothetical protein [Variovorax sp. PAMC 28711]|uniref:hypothetical protein n=1 Tax=Variovorax sp. PAMC 28711 TaxID=1795631 RepID=UPI00078DA0D3|nr:hypothetical protein [Variovorax sp. PAMC 28711]AMM22990.1 hypothetical protein AX767_00295 [Variovorax sp. PAMC 28711]
MTMNPIRGFSPDSDPTTPGILTACSNVIPFAAGYKGAPSPVAVNAPALAAEARGAVVATRLDGSRRVFAGTQTRLYELLSAAWTDRSAGGVAYTGSSESRWSFAQFGDTTVATNLADPMQSSASGAFAAIAGAPKAKIVVSASNNFVIAFSTNEGTYGPSPDRWWCCAQSDQTNWTPSVATSAQTGRLIAIEGAIQAAQTLGDYVVAYKQRAIFLGVFAGAGGVVWQWNLVPGGEAGAVGQEAVCDIGGRHFIVGNDNFWIFDGTRPEPVGDGVTRQWFLDNSSPTYRYRTKVVYDKQNNLVRVNYPSLTSTGACDACLVYHVGKKEWGVSDVVIQAPLNYIAPGVTIDGLNAYAATIDALPNIPFDSQYWASGGQTPSYFNASNQLVAMNGATGASSFTTSDIGDDAAVTMIEQARVRFSRVPDSANATGFYAMNEGEPLVAGAVCPRNEGKFDLYQSARYHRVRFDFTGDHQETGYDLPLKQVGGR